MVIRLVAVAVSVAVLSTAALWAATIGATGRDDHSYGAAEADSLVDGGGDRLLYGLGGNVALDGGLRRAALLGAASGGHIARVRGVDASRCGPGRVAIRARLVDRAASRCVSLVRRLSRDSLSDAGAQHETEVEPAAAAWGQTVVAAFQVGRFAGGGGAAGIGFATSPDGGRSWRSGFLPELTIYSHPPGGAAAASDPSVAFDAVHREWLISSLVATPEGVGAAVSRSRDGLTWSRPVLAAVSSGDLDKEWLACDSWTSSPFRGHCYLSYLDVAANQIATRTSVDGGRTWSSQEAPPGAPPPTIVNGAQPVVRPDGTLVVLYMSLDPLSELDGDLLAVRSTDGGASFSSPTRAARVRLENVYELRSPALPAASVDASGRLYVVWQDCRFTDQCQTVDLVLSSSADGLNWSAPRRIPTTVPSALTPSVVPGFAVDPTTSGRSARLGLVFDTVSEGCVPYPYCVSVDAYLTSSPDGGASWSHPERLNAQTMPVAWIADGGIGAMVGDYQAVAFAHGTPIPVVSLASKPAPDSTFRQAIYAGVPPQRPG